MENIFQKINELSLRYTGFTANNLSRLVQIKSLSTKEKDIQTELRKQMTEAGFDEVRTDGMGNLIGRIGNGKKVIAFDGHVDTVDTGNPENWSFNPFSGEIRNGYIQGRGSVDQKGGIAAFVTAGRIMQEMGLGKDLTVYFVGSVIEEDCEGLCWKYLIEEEKLNPDLVICTEPTNLNICRGQRGRIEILVSFYGVSSHGSAPERGKSAIDMASSVVLEIKKLNEKLISDDFLGKGSIAVTEINSRSPSLCAIPDYASIHIDRRITVGETKETVLKEIEDLLTGYRAKVEVLRFEEKAWTGIECEMEKFYPAWTINEDHYLVRTAVEAFRKLTGKEPLVDKWVFSTNGIMTCGTYGIPTIGFGPGNEVLAHAPDEKVPISDLVTASAFYAGLIYDINQL